MPRKPSGADRLFTREDIYRIRNFWDEKVEEGWTFAHIASALSEEFYPASNQTLIRIGKRETWRELGVGSTERPNISNRLAGEARKAGDYARPFRGAEYRIPELSDEEIARRSVGVVVPELEIGPDGLAKVKSPGMEGLKMLLDRSGVVLDHINPKPIPPSPLDGGEPVSDAEEESPMDILARKAREEKK